MNAEPLTIQLRRQGVSHMTRGWFAPCEHGETWHIEFVDYQSRSWLCEVSFPNCHECYGPKTTMPARGTPEYGILTHRQFYALQMKRMKEDHAGQIAWSNRETSAADIDLETAKKRTSRAIGKLVGRPVIFAPEIEAYMYNNNWSLNHYPYQKRDVYLTCASYEPGSDTIRHEPTNVCLIAFDGETEARFDIDKAAEKYRPLIDKAYHEFMKGFNRQGQTNREAKCWLAWLLGEYIKKVGDTPVRRTTMDKWPGQESGQSGQPYTGSRQHEAQDV